MARWTLLLALLSAATTSTTASLVQLPQRRATSNGITGNGNDLDNQTYDYVVVGGGLAGLVIASRLSEDADVSVAVIEAGPSGEGDDTLTTPAANLYASSVGTNKDWQYTTTNQAGLNGRSTPWPRGKVLGGSSAINGLYMVRQSQVEQDAWAQLAGANASDIWGWPNMLANMKRSEHFHHPTSSVQAQLGENIDWNDASHGTDGPIHVTWPATTFDSVGAFIQSAIGVGSPANRDPDSGNNTGAFVATSAINPANWTRSFSRTGYLDPVLGRSNLHVLTGHMATRVLFDNGAPLKATAVAYASGAGQASHTVNARREVILSAGAIGTPALLQHSGVGDRSVLDPAGITQVLDLPGVGFHLQDHLSTAVTFSPKGSTAKPAARITGDAQQDSFVNSAIAYLSIDTLYGDYANTILSELRSNMDNTSASYDAPPTVQAGYRATFERQVNAVYGSNVGPIELLFANSFGNIQVQCALQHPFSRGSIKVTSRDPFQQPAIDAGYLANALDLEILREGIKTARMVGQTPPLSDLLGGEITPGAGTSSDDDWNNFVRTSSGTEYHPMASCSMLPREQGGCVDANLLVYGTSNLRIIDASVPPLSMAMHMMTAVYGLSEIGADIIKAARKNVTYPGGQPISSGGNNGGSAGSGAASGSGSGSGSTASGSNGSGNASSAASLAVSGSAALLLLAAGAAALGLLVA